MSLKELKLSSKVLLPWFFVLILLVGLLLFRVSQNKINYKMEHHRSIHIQMVERATEIQLDETEIWLLSLEYLLSKDPSIPDNIYTTLNNIQSLGLELRILTENELKQQEKDLSSVHHNLTVLESYFISRSGFPDLYDKFVRSVKKGNLTQANNLASIMADKFKTVNASLDDLTSYHNKLVFIINQKEFLSQIRSDRIFNILLITFIIFGIIFSRIQILTIANPIIKLTKAAQEIENGKDADLSVFYGENEIGFMSIAFDKMVVSLKDSEKEILDQKNKLKEAYTEVEKNIAERTKELFLKTSALEEANRELSSFSYTVSHDLRAPLRSMTGFAELLKNNALGKLGSKNDHYLELISSSAADMGQLIDALLSFSRMSRSKMTIETINLNELIKSIVSMYREETEERTIQWEIMDLPPIRGDRALMKQVFANLIDNGVKYSGKEERPLVEIGWESDEDKYIFFVKDNGTGFDMKYKDKLFTVFERLHTTSEFEGTGIGLATVHRIITRHGGETWAESKINEGSTFYFSINKTPEEQNAK